MKASTGYITGLPCVLLWVVQWSSQVSASGTQFASHVSVNTPARSFTHGVGDPISTLARRSNPAQTNSFRKFRRPMYEQPPGNGYPRMRPAIPFNNEDITRGNSLSVAPWLYNNNMDISIPVLPPSPYKVDSPDPESLWPEGLFLPPISPPRFQHSISRTDTDTASDPLDPYLLEGSEAIAAVAKANSHGHLYFHEIPHIESLLENQELRIQNKLKPHRLGSIRHTWPYNRP
ncbi:unnamed protein product [Chilo suppressalis]|uniref:Uncharacterized protein n=1 Tax=Chilo suppressalis TaxID=168631 RepID=A0ABN8L479_CHISP|nr:unnamed protein product [Chilo suppressalis]